MNKLTSILFAAALALSCAHVTPIVKECGAQTVAGLLGDVNTALATGEYVAELETLVAKFGLCAVNAAVKEVLAQATGNAQLDALEAQKVDRAKAWLATHPG